MGSYTDEELNINILAAEIHADAVAHGWWKDITYGSDATSKPEFIQKLALMHSELSETLEEIRNGHAIDETYFSESASGAKPEGVPIELADTVIRILDTCAYYGIDIGNAIKLKMAYNKLRPYRHGDKVL